VRYQLKVVVTIMTVPTNRRKQQTGKERELKQIANEWIKKIEISAGPKGVSGSTLT